MTLRAVYDRQKKHDVVEVAFRGIPYAEFDRTGISILTVLITDSPHVHDAWSMITRTECFLYWLSLNAVVCFLNSQSI